MPYALLCHSQIYVYTFTYSYASPFVSNVYLPCIAPLNTVATYDLPTCEPFEINCHATFRNIATRRASFSPIIQKLSTAKISCKNSIYISFEVLQTSSGKAYLRNTVVRHTKLNAPFPPKFSQQSSPNPPPSLASRSRNTQLQSWRRSLLGSRAG